MIAIVDYNAGNLVSVRLALEHLSIDAVITRDPVVVENAERVIFPGVGAAGEAMDNIRGLGLLDSLRATVAKGTPFLGICLGAQILFSHSEENGGTDCIGLVPGEVKRFQPSDPLCKVPQIGWNAVSVQGSHPLFENIEDASEFYFVHSYYCAPSDPAHTLGKTEYADVTFAAAVGAGNLAATQFHPERSGRIGLRLLDNFSRWDGSC